MRKRMKESNKIFIPKAPQQSYGVRKIVDQ